jgi:peptide/nickel transport system substrate-binding protein
VPAFEPGKARSLLAAAGYAGGLDLTLNYSTGPGPFVEELILELAEAGIRVKPVELSSGEFRDQVLRCDGDLHLNGWFCSTGDASELLEGNFTSAAQRSNGTNSLRCRYSNPDVDRAVSEAARSLDPVERREILRKALRLVLEDLPWIPLTVPYDRYAMTPGVVWEPRADGEIFLPEVREKQAR